MRTYALGSTSNPFSGSDINRARNKRVACTKPIFYREDGSDKFLRNVGSHTAYSARYPRERQRSYRSGECRLLGCHTLWLLDEQIFGRGENYITVIIYSYYYGIVFQGILFISQYSGSHKRHFWSISRSFNECGFVYVSTHLIHVFRYPTVVTYDISLNDPELLGFWTS
jgi:hypothetical protein